MLIAARVAKQTLGIAPLHKGVHRMLRARLTVLVVVLQAILARGRPGGTAAASMDIVEPPTTIAARAVKSHSGAVPQH